MHADNMGLVKERVPVMKLCAVGSQGRNFVAASLADSDVINRNAGLDDIDVLFIVSEMEDDKCCEQAKTLSQKAINKGILTLLLCSEETEASEALQHQVHAVLLLSEGDWQSMPISERYALIFQRIRISNQADTFININLNDLRDTFGLHQKLIVNYCMANDEAQLEYIGERLLSEKSENIEYAMFLGCFNERNLSGTCMAVSGLESNLHEDAHIFFAVSEALLKNCYFDSILFIR